MAGGMVTAGRAWLIATLTAVLAVAVLVATALASLVEGGALSPRPVFSRICLLLAVLVVVAGVSGSVGPTAAHAATAFSSVSGLGGGVVSNPQRGAVLGSSGELFVADRDNDRVVVFDVGSGSVVGEFGDAGSMDDPFGVAVDQVSGDVFVSSSASNTVTKWSDSGLGFVQDGLFASPPAGWDPGQVASFASPLAIDPVSGDLLLADTGLQRIVRFDSMSGAQVGVEFNGEDLTAPESPAFSQVKDMTVDQATGDVYVTDGGRVVRYSSAFEFEARLDGGPGPAVVAVDPTSGDVVVSGSSDDPCSTNRVYAFEGTAAVSRSDVPPAANDCTAVNGLAFDAAGRLFAINGGAYGGCCGGQMSIEAMERTAPLAYSASTTPATNVTETSARLRGSIDPAGNDVTYAFEHAPAGGGWSRVRPPGCDPNLSECPDEGPFDDPSPVAVQANVSGLSDGAEHRYRIALRAPANPGVVVYSNTTTFTTVDGDPPTIALDPITDVSSSGFTLNAEINPNGLATRYRFEASADQGNNWTALPGPDSDPATDDQAGNGTDPVAVSATAAGLEPNRSYLYRLIATNPVGSSQAESPDQVVTLGEQAQIDESTSAASFVTAISARISAMVNPRNTDTGWHIEYGASDSYGSSSATATVAAPAFDPNLDNAFDPDTRSRTAARTLEGLQPATTYHYRLVVDNGNGPAVATADQTFTTAAAPPTVQQPTVADVTTATARLQASVDTHGQAGTATFSIVQTDGGHSQTAGPVALAATDGPQPVAVAVSALPAGGSYTVRVSVTTSGGQRTSDPVAFATQPQPGYMPPPTSGGGGDWQQLLPPIEPDDPDRPSNTITIRVTTAGAIATVVTRVPGAGVLHANGKRLTKTTKRATRAGSVKLRIKLRPAARRALRKTANGRLATALTLTFTPTDGDATTIRRTLTFKRKASR